MEEQLEEVSRLHNIRKDEKEVDHIFYNPLQLKEPRYPVAAVEVLESLRSGSVETPAIVKAESF